MNNIFLHKLAIIIYNIDAEVMYSEIFSSLQKVFCFKGFERTYTTNSDDKWIMLTTKTSKDIATMFVDNLIKNSNTPNINPNKRPGGGTKFNINSTFLNYTAMIKNNNRADTTKKIYPFEYKHETFKFVTNSHRQ